MGRPKKRKPLSKGVANDAGTPSKGAAKSRKTGKKGGAELARANLNETPYARNRHDDELLKLSSPKDWPTEYWLAIAAFAVVTLYSYWPTIAWMVDNWINEPDYTHGWAVPVLAVMICYFRRESFPGVSKGISWAGISLIVTAILMRLLSRFTYTDFLDAWSILPMVAGGVWCLLGFRAMVWALPAIGFLFFAVPMPYQVESLLSWKLQGVATALSTIMLRVFGLPAVAEGHVVWIGNERLSIEAACSGLRIFVGMGAFAVFWAASNVRAWSDKIVILAAAIPAAIFVNSARIVLIGFGYVLADGEASRRMIHDVSGIAMVFASFGVMWLVSVYWQKLYAPVKKMTAREILRESTVNYAQSEDRVMESPVEAS